MDGGTIRAMARDRIQQATPDLFSTPSTGVIHQTYLRRSRIACVGLACASTTKPQEEHNESA
jgi:hypothetical protein